MDYNARDVILLIAITLFALAVIKVAIDSFGKNKDGASVKVNINAHPLIIDVDIPGGYAEIKETSKLGNGFVQYKIYNPEKGFFFKEYPEGHLKLLKGSHDAVGYNREVYIPATGLFTDEEQVNTMTEYSKKIKDLLETISLLKQENHLLQNNMDEKVASAIDKALQNNVNKFGFKKE